MKVSTIAWISGTALGMVLGGVAIFKASTMTTAYDKARIKRERARTVDDQAMFSAYEEAKSKKREFDKTIEDRAAKAVAESKDLNELSEKITKLKKKNPDADVSELKEREREIKESLKKAEYAKEEETKNFLESEVNRTREACDKVLKRESDYINSLDGRELFLQELRDMGFTKTSFKLIGLIPVGVGVIFLGSYTKVIFDIANQL